MANLWVRKSIDALKAEAEYSDSHGGLKRTLTATNLTMLGIGAIIGAGFFVLTGTAAAENAGPAVALSFVLGGIVCAFAGLCYAEMASTVPIAGSAYTYAYATMGEFIAWLIGWDLILEYMVGATTVAIGWSGYVASFLHDAGVDIPAWLASSPGTRMVDVPDAVAKALHMRHGWSPLESVAEILTKHDIDPSTFHQVTAVINLPAILIVVAVTALLVVGIQESARVNNVIVVIKVAIVLAFIAFRAGPRLDGQLGREVHPRRTPASSANTAGAGSSAGPGSSSSPTSASTPSRQPPRRPRTPSATCRSASSARS